MNDSPKLNSSYDLAVVGAGAAGASAAVTAAAQGLSVVVLDEAARGGDAIHPRTERWMEASAGPRHDEVQDALSQCGAEVVYECCVWHVGLHVPGEASLARFELSTVGRDGRGQTSSAALIVATGARERSYPRPGWTLPGVFALGEALIALESGLAFSGKRVAVVGPGERARSVAARIAAERGIVVADIDPDDGWDASSINGSERVESLTLAEVDGEGRPLAQGRKKTLEADAVCIGYGLSPACEIYHLLGAKLRYAPELGGWVPVVDGGQRTDIARLYGAGDSAGVLGSGSARYTGRVAALTAAFDLGRLDEEGHERELRDARRAQPRTAGAGMPMPAFPLRSSAIGWVTDDTIVCRCESIRAGELRVAIASGAREINALKAATRCGMGPCGGRVCEEGAAALLECAGLSHETIGKLTARAPLRPLPMSAITGTFAYGDIPFPQAADT